MKSSDDFKELKICERSRQLTMCGTAAVNVDDSQPFSIFPKYCTLYDLLEGLQ